MGKTTIGIDAGISTTKIVGLKDGNVISPVRTKVSDRASLQAALGKYLQDNGIAPDEVEKVMMTGVGSRLVNDELFGLPVHKVEEFVANAMGARFISNEDHMMVVSMGTGTSFVRCDGDDISHAGGIGMGGGTLQGLSQLLLNTDDVARVVQMAETGSLGQVNLLIGDISDKPLPDLPMDATASLFGNVHDTATLNDIASGLICMVVQTIGSATVLATQGCGLGKAVMIGTLTRLPQCRTIFKEMEKLYGIRFIIPEYAEYCTAIGAVVSKG